MAGEADGWGHSSPTHPRQQKPYQNSGPSKGGQDKGREEIDWKLMGESAQPCLRLKLKRVSSLLCPGVFKFLSGRCLAFASSPFPGSPSSGCKQGKVVLQPWKEGEQNGVPGVCVERRERWPFGIARRKNEATTIARFSCQLCRQMLGRHPHLPPSLPPSGFASLVASATSERIDFLRARKRKRLQRNSIPSRRFLAAPARLSARKREREIRLRICYFFFPVQVGGVFGSCSSSSSSRRRNGRPSAAGEPGRFA